MAPKEKPRVIALAGARRGSNTQVNDMPNTATDTSKKSSRYREMLALPQWQKRRLQMLEKAGWKCVECGAEEQQLHVHHKRYIAGAKPWEYEDEDLAVLCERCHERAHGRELTAQPLKTKKRRPPSTACTLLRLVLQCPALVKRLPIELIKADSGPEWGALAAIASLSADEPQMQARGAGAMLERFRGTQHAETLEYAVAELVDAEFDESAVEAILEESVRKIRSDDIGCRIGALLQKDRVGMLTKEGREQLAAMLLEKRQITEDAIEAAERATTERRAAKNKATEEEVLAALEKLRSKNSGAPEAQERGAHQ